MTDPFPMSLPPAPGDSYELRDDHTARSVFCFKATASLSTLFCVGPKGVLAIFQNHPPCLTTARPGPLPQCHRSVSCFLRRIEQLLARFLCRAVAVDVPVQGRRCHAETLS